MTAILELTNWFEPVDWYKIFGNEHPIEIDIGCGKGAFLVWAAQNRPEHNFVGIERQWGRLQQVDRKIQRAGLTNVLLLRVEASYFVAKLVPTNSVVAYHILFPDPWPKRRHQRHRLFQMSFVAELHRTLQPRGNLNVFTDNAEYALQIEKLIDESRNFSMAMGEILPAEARSEFEKIFVAAGKRIFRGRFERC